MGGAPLTTSVGPVRWMLGTHASEQCTFHPFELYPFAVGGFLVHSSGHVEREGRPAFRHTGAAMKSVLIVDDEVDSRRALELLLRLHGFDGATAEDGEEALGLLRHRHFDVIITDWMMPRMSGAELLARIRAERLAEDTPIIVVTAAAESARSVLRDPVCILGKPLDIGKLLAAMDELA